MGLKRKFIEEDIDEITAAILTELEGSGQLLGYKTLWQKLKLVYGLSVKRETVLELLQVLDPEGIEERSRYRLKRRQYKALGPNYIHHIDGYDKLTPYCFCTHGAVDGYSRKCLWLAVATTNHKPEVISHYYLHTIKKLGKIPTLIRSDRGTENNLVELLHIAFRSDHEDPLSGQKSFFKGQVDGEPTD